MLYRKISNLIENHLASHTDSILLIYGARQIGKTFIIREVGKKLFKNFVEINMIEDANGPGLFKNVTTVDDFLLHLSMVAGGKLGDHDDTLVFIDEIQEYPELITLLKFLRTKGRYTYIASGSLLGVHLNGVSSIPMGSIMKVQMFPLDFEEFLLANNVGREAIEEQKKLFENELSPTPEEHSFFLDLFRKYLLTGGLPDAINEYLRSRNIHKIRAIQNETREFYAMDAAKYDKKNKLKVERLYNTIPSFMENKKKRLIVRKIEEKKGKTFSDYASELLYVVNSGIALEVDAISNPSYPLAESETKSLLKLYMNDPGILSSIFYGDNIKAILNDEKSINLGAIYETAVACQLRANGYDLFYYDNKSKGEVDFLIDDTKSLSVIPIEVKSGRDFMVHSSLNTFTTNEDYGVKKAYVLSNSGTVLKKGIITYIPIYWTMFIQKQSFSDEELIIP